MIENLVFRGGGVKAVAYLGALEVLGAAGVLAKLKRAAGTSAGALVAALVAAGATPADLRRVVEHMPFSRFLGRGGPFGWLEDGFRFVGRYGLNDGAAIERWFEICLASIGLPRGLTFAGLRALHRIDLSIIATDLSAGEPRVYDADKTPLTRIAEAARASCTIPFFFVPYVDENGHYLVDGGYSWNYPVDLFDESKTEKNWATLGLWVGAVKDFDPGPQAITGLRSYVSAMISFGEEAANATHISEADKPRTVFISSADISATDFDLTDHQIAALKQSGRDGAREWLAMRAESGVN